jgi:bifunctional DNA-binding transcriptional regulator/antitoxin component of YhaV-PrlF toxin-antitoxin module
VDTKTLTVEIAEDGTLVIPVDLVRALGLSPHQTITLETRADRLVLVPCEKERLDRIGHLLRDALKGVEWSEVEAGRQDRCFSA